MALKVWLPLNKDLRNVGLENVKAEKNGSSVVFQTDTSFNKVLYFGTTNANGSVYFPPEKFTGYTAMSVSFYVNFLTFDADYSNLIGFFNSATAGDIYDANKIFSFYKHVNTTGTTAQFRFFVNLSTSNYILTNSFGTNTWQHFVLVNDDKKIILYQNGVKIGEVTFSSNIQYSEIKRVSFGQSNNTNGTRHCNAKMSDFRIYDHALTEEDIKSIYQKKIFDLVPYSGIKNVLFDRSGFCMKHLIDSSEKYYSNSVYFNGTNQIIKSRENGFEISGGTLSVWFLPKTKPSGNGTIFYLDGNSRMACGLYNNATSFIVSTKTSSPMFPATGVTYGEWNHVCIVYGTDFAATNCYLNGVKLTGSSTNNWTNDKSIIEIGGRTLYSSFFDGKVSCIRVYKSQLTQDDALKLYNTERNMFLPDEYEELEYIQSNGNQWIDTGINGFNSGDWEIYCEWMSVAAPAQSYGYIFGVYEGENYNSYRLIHKTTSTTEYYVSAKSKAGGGSILLSNVALNAKHSIKIKNGTFTCDGVSYTASTTGTSLPSANTMLLFKSKNNLYSKCRIYSAWAKKDGILKYNMIPSKRKSDNVIGMYDMVSRQFFTNSGTGSFTGA